MAFGQSVYLAYLHLLGLTHRQLASIFPSEVNAQAIVESLSISTLVERGIKEEKAFDLIAHKHMHSLEKVQATLERHSVSIVTMRDNTYPALLREIANPPFLLYVRWILSIEKPLLAIVWSRKPTAYSWQVLRMMIPDMINTGFGIVSGGAYGVDALAHKITLDHRGYTIVVIGTGIDQCYPASHKSLYESVIDRSGAVISLFPLFTGPDPYNFPIRNELISGLCKGVLITEAGEPSGTLITAHLALDQNRELFVVPGDITRESSRGSNALIRDGKAKAVLSSADISVEFGYRSDIAIHKAIPTFTDPVEGLIVDLIRKQSLDVEAIADTLHLEISTVTAKLALLEVMGHIRWSASGLYEIV